MDSPVNRPRVVKLANPLLCLRCRFACIAVVIAEDGTEQRMLHCKRLDCDNWETDPQAPSIRAIKCDDTTNR
jgi:hypothetical protein